MELLLGAVVSGVVGLCALTIIGLAMINLRKSQNAAAGAARVDNDTVILHQLPLRHWSTITVQNAAAGAARVDNDTVILHQLSRGSKAPCVSPFPLKLETYLRMQEIPYVNDFTSPFAKSTKKTPWMEYNGVKVADSQLCIEHLKAQRGIKPDPHLSDSERGIARGFLKLTEENLYWCMCSVTFMEKNKRYLGNLPYTGLKFQLISRILTRTIRNEMYGHGIGRHSVDTIAQIGHDDLQALSHFLADKPFLMGDLPSEIDCAVFGMLVQIIYHLPECKLDQAIKNEFTNLEAFVNRMRERFWPDWDDCLAK